MFIVQGLLDENGYNAVKAGADLTQVAVDNEDWETATNRWSLTESIVSLYQI